ncbi:alpha-amylase [Mucilaginibacter glaciei]|uniref:Alpha-amylase n=1 Tax=Mucilaginibacter glaciei TaxID=2772109 RepID=A0A926S1G4_9SPHI|nr:alpha-amylase [Mucilaginibacter glaciei]MBD1393053.1 alpha-amylase [Mucilaginibacter glaciei]
MENFTMLQFFEWYTNGDGNWWDHLKDESGRLKSIGIDAVWLPPAYKGAAGGYSVGYDVYDIYDLGEFDQKGSVRTKYGTKQQYLDAIQAAKGAGLSVYADIVLNHMGGAEEAEKFMVRKVNPDNRNEFISDPYEIESFTKFTFPGRQGNYSQFVWDWKCFSGVDYDSNTQETAIYSIQNEAGEAWEDVIGDENGNFDYLMLNDIDTRNPAVRDELKRWGKWYVETAQFDGMRLDAIKHMSFDFYNDWLDHLRGELQQELFTVGEYWSFEIGDLQKYIDATGGRMSLFDAPLHNAFHVASVKGKDYDLSKIFDNSLVAANPALAVTLVENHDTQPLQSLEQPVDYWFKPLGYALILLRADGYPCIFYPDLYGAAYKDKDAEGNEQEIILAKVEELEPMLYVRKHLAYGQQRDYFDHPNCIGWTREGDGDHENSGCAVVLSNGDEGSKTMEIGKAHAGKVFVDYLSKHDAEVTVNEDGWAEFFTRAGSVSVWALKN